jgi:ribosomal protein S18 acetylase RimI-like enzyme
MPITVRHLKAADLPLLEEMYDRFVPHRAAMGLPPADPVERRAWLAGLRNGVNLVAFVNDSLAGHLALMPGPDFAELACFVHQDFRRRGVATALVRQSVREAEAAGLSAIWVLIDSSNTAARQGLRNFGFRAAWEDLREAQYVLPVPKPVAT